jgi:tRNA A58 N-methylase Trm61
MIRASLVVTLLLFACGTSTNSHPTTEPAPESALPKTTDETQKSSAEEAPQSVEASVRPGANEKFLDPNMNVDTWVKRFEGESREVYASRSAIVAALELSKGASVADIGAGTGFFSELFAKAVGEEGRVYANEISPRFLEHLRNQKSTKDWSNVEIVVGTERSVELPEASVDAVFVCDVYHHFEYPNTVLKSILRTLKPGGQLVIVDFKRVEGESSEWVMGHVRAGQEVFSNEIQEAGFRLEGELNVEGLRDNYMLRFRKP